MYHATVDKVLSDWISIHGTSYFEDAEWIDDKAPGLFNITYRYAIKSVCKRESRLFTREFTDYCSSERIKKRGALEKLKSVEGQEMVLPSLPLEKYAEFFKISEEDAGNLVKNVTEYLTDYAVENGIRLREYSGAKLLVLGIHL